MTNDLRDILLKRIGESDQPHEVLRSSELRALADDLKNLPQEQRAEAGRSLNELKQSLIVAIKQREAELLDAAVEPIDITAPMGVNSQ
ncbi:hypothetical protein KC953_03545, partial [Candidatus Saccharibacteria bacterium]|nr:hypothetical protein [Candidatus Saccharibacteria bacterium]